MVDGGRQSRRKGAHGARLSAQSGGRKDEDTSGLARRVWAVKGARRGEGRSAESSWRRRGASTAILGERAVDCDAW